MDLTGIIAISGKPGLFKVIASNRTSLVVESLVDGKRTVALPTHRISALEDISIYTIDEDVPLKDVYQNIYEKENGAAAINHKEDAGALKAYLGEILPDWDEDRVYNSDIKKMFQWYNILQASGALEEAMKSEAEAASEEE